MMNDIEMPLLESQCTNIDNETIKYAQKVCLYLLVFCMGILTIVLFSEFLFGKGERIDTIAKIVTGISLTVSSILLYILLYLISY